MKPFAIPTSLSGSSNSNTKITLTWSGGAGASYQGYWTSSNTTRPTDGSSTFDLSLGSSSPYDWTSMSRGTTYYFYVRSIYTNGTTTYYTNWYPAAAPGSSGKAPLYPPNTPTNFAGTVASSTQIDLSWTASATDTTHDSASSYDIYYSTSTTAPTSSTAATTTSTTTSKSITGLTASTAYYFWIRATNADNTGSSGSSWSSRLDKTTSSGVTNYTVTFKANGGTGSDYTQTASTTTALTLNSFTKADTFVTPTFTGTLPSFTSATNFQRTASTLRYGWGNGTQTWSGTINDYNFNGWNTAANGSGTSYANGANYAFTADLTLYAQWTTSRRARGFNYQVRNTNSTTSTTNIEADSYKPYTTTNDTRATVNSVNYPYLLYTGGTSPDFAYSANPRYARIQLYQFGTDGNEYNSSWTSPMI